MPRIFLSSAGIAFQNLRANLFHTLLSTLGIVIGVAALVSILALGDGMEQYGRQQVSGTTSVQSILVSTITHERMEGIAIRKESIPVLNAAHVADLRKALPQPAQYLLQTTAGGLVHLQGDTIRKPARVVGTAGDLPVEKITLAHGRLFSDEEESVVLLSNTLATGLARGQAPESLLGQQLVFQNQTLQVIGILAPVKGDEVPRALLPIGQLDPALVQQDPPELIITANRVEDVPALKSGLEKFLNAHIKGGKAGFEIITNEVRIEQLMEAILLFKIVMGLITGIAILVGGIGVMNVLLMSVTERTREIGIRKATGATRSDISAQFLAEALAISLTGSLIGFVLGMAMTMGLTPLIRTFTKIPFYAAFDYRSFLVVVVVAILTGITFGVYPARKAARLMPVDAIRQE